MKLSLIVPCFNEEENIKLFYDEVKKYFKHHIHQYEIIFINDGSQDKTYNELKRLYQKHSKEMTIIQFSRNFGKEAAILAGLRKSSGEYVTIIDADLQQSPRYVVEMVNFLEQHKEYDSVAAYQKSREERKIIIFFKNLFYKLMNKITEIEIYQSASDFRTFRRNVVETIEQLPERCRFSKGIFAWVGFNTYFMPYDVEQRVNGESKWSLMKLWTYALDGIAAFSTTPLILSSIIGIIITILAFMFMIYVAIETVVWKEKATGYSILITVILLLSGIQLFSIGILGHYLAKNYTESKQRPIYVVKECVDRKKEYDE